MSVAPLYFNLWVYRRVFLQSLLLPNNIFLDRLHILDFRWISASTIKNNDRLIICLIERCYMPTQSLLSSGTDKIDKSEKGGKRLIKTGLLLKNVKRADNDG